MDDAQVWRERIAEAYWKVGESYMETGRLLLAAKEALPHGQFGKMIAEQLPFKRNWAHRYMAIACGRLANVSPGIQLPAEVKTLYELTKLDDGAYALAGVIVRGRVYERRKNRLGGSRPKGSGAPCASDPHTTAEQVGKEFGTGRSCPPVLGGPALPVIDSGYLYQGQDRYERKGGAPQGQVRRAPTPQEAGGLGSGAVSWVRRPYCIST